MAMEEGKEGLFFVKADSINAIFGNKIENEQSKYFYTPLKISNVNEHQNEYPIFLYLHKNKIEFRYSGELNIDKDSKDENKSIERLPENEIITINFKLDYFLHIDINEQIKSLVVEEFPILDEYSLSTTIKRNQTLSYINTFRSPSLSHKDRRLNFATLFLNLLFDFKYNPEVFSDDPNFENIKSHFLNSKFIQSILSKAEFYYKFSKLLAPSYLNQSENRLLVKNVKTACKNWLDLLMENRISEVINNKNNWFTDVETEMTNALTFEKESLKKSKNEKINEGIKENSIELRKHTTDWFISRNNVLRAWIENTSIEIAILTGVLIMLFYFIGSIILGVFDKQFELPLYIEFKGNMLYLIPLLSLSLIFLTREIYINIYNYFTKNKKDFKGKKINLILLYEVILNILMDIFMFVMKFFKYLLIPLWALIFGATHIVFYTSSFYNELFIKNAWIYELSIFLISFLITSIVFKITKRWTIRKFKMNRPISLIIALCCVFLFPRLVLGKFPSLNSFILSFVLLSVIFSLLYQHERNEHKTLQVETSRNKVVSMMFYGLIISFFTNLFYINTEYKEYLDRYEHIGHIWHNTYHNENDFKFLQQNELYELDSLSIGENKHEAPEYIYMSNVEDKDTDHFKKVKKIIYQPLSDDIEVLIDKYFFDQLKYVYLLEEVGEHSNKFRRSNVPVLKEINVNGIIIRTLPNVLFVNTFLSLLVAVVLQIFINKTKFLTGGGH